MIADQFNKHFGNMPANALDCASNTRILDLIVPVLSRTNFSERSSFAALYIGLRIKLIAFQISSLMSWLQHWVNTIITQDLLLKIWETFLRGPKWLLIDKFKKEWKWYLSINDINETRSFFYSAYSITAVFSAAVAN